MTKNVVKKWLPALGCSCLLVSGVSSNAQTQEFSFSLAGGLGGAHYKVQTGNSELKPGFQVGFGYMRSFYSRWGIRTGIGLGLYQSKATLDPNTLHTSYEVDSENDAFEYRVKTIGYKEDQKIYTVNIPLMLQYHPKFNQNGFYGQVGVKLGLPFKNDFKTKADQVTATGYYPDFNVEFTDLPQHGFGAQNGWSGKGEYELKISWSLAAELGWRFRISSKSNIYAGLFIDYGLNNIKKNEGDQMLLAYSPGGLTQSEPKGIFSLQEETGNARLIAYGVKLRFGLGAHKKEREKEKAVQPVIVPAPVKPDTIVAVAAAPVIEDSVVVEVKPEPVAEIPVKKMPAPGEQKLLDAPFLFGKPGDIELSAQSRVHVQSVAAVLKAYPDLSIVVEGHTCNIGTGEANEKVGLARATAVATMLQQEGVDASRIQTVSKAHLEPVAPNDTESNRRKNRRVVLKII